MCLRAAGLPHLRASQSLPGKKVLAVDVLSLRHHRGHRPHLLSTLQADSALGAIVFLAETLPSGLLKNHKEQG